MGEGISNLASPTAIRTFLAVELTPEIRKRLSLFHSDLDGFRPILKVVNPDLLHITVRFLGRVALDSLPSVLGVATTTAGETAPFVLKTSGVGHFPARGAPRVVWVGLEQDDGYREMARLFERLENRLQALGFEREGRPFAPHITLARVREGTPAPETLDLQRVLADMRDDSRAENCFEVDRLSVMRSDLSPQGPKYIPLLRARIGDTS